MLRSPGMQEVPGFNSEIKLTYRPSPLLHYTVTLGHLNRCVGQKQFQLSLPLWAPSRWRIDPQLPSYWDMISPDLCH